jgi:hypothetical protein
MARFFVVSCAPGNLSDCAGERRAHLHGVRHNLFRDADIFFTFTSLFDPYTEQLCNCHIDDVVGCGYLSPHRRKSFVLQCSVRTLRAFLKTGFEFRESILMATNAFSFMFSLSCP